MAHGEGLADRDVVIQKKVPGLATRHLQLTKPKRAVENPLPF